MPSEDGVSYLWMAEQFAIGEWSAGFSTVFPAGFPLLVAPFIACGLAPEAAGDACNAALMALSMWPLARIARQLSPGVTDAVLATCVLFVSGSLMARVAAEGYSEPAFWLAMAWGTTLGLGGRFWWLGAVSGAAFWIRPEGLLLAGSFVLARPRQAWPALVGAGAGVLLLAASRWLAGHAFDPLPILAFHGARDDLPLRGAVLHNLPAVPGRWLEAFGLSGVLLLAWLLPRARRVLPKAPALWWQIALQIAVVCTFVVRRRFLLSCAVPVFAFAGAALARLRSPWRHWLLLAIALLGGVGAFRGGIDPDRIAERRLGEFLAGRLQPGEQVSGELTRVVWFAGQRPLPPRHFDVEQLAALATPASVRYFVVSIRSKRASSRQIAERLVADFAPLELPVGLAELCDRRGILVLQRR